MKKNSSEKRFERISIECYKTTRFLYEKRIHFYERCFSRGKRNYFYEKRVRFITFYENAFKAFFARIFFFMGSIVYFYHRDSNIQRKEVKMFQLFIY